MTGRQILASLLFLAVSVTIAWLVVTSEHRVPLIPVEEGPRPPVAADPRTTAQVLAGVGEALPYQGNDLRKRRNGLAQEHRAALEAWRLGRTSLREVESLEQSLWVARAQVGEVDAQELHLRLAELFERERQRLVQLQEQGLAGEDQLHRAALYVARERHLAGLPVEDAAGRDYETLRRDYLASFRARHETLVEAGLGHREQLHLDLQQLERDFPPPAPAAGM